MTEKQFISEPVAGRVNTAPMGRADCRTLPPEVRICQGSPPVKGIAPAINFVPSRTDPPPTDSRKSTFSF
jgi:hypothetical protein